MSDKVSSDETNLENIAIVNRPLNIAAEYSNLCTQAWLEAKQALDGMDEGLGCRSEDEKVKFLCEVLMVMYYFISFIKFSRQLMTVMLNI